MLCAIWLLAHCANAQRRDVVVIKNGDQITGKIRKLDHGQLFIETSYTMEQIPVDWLQVERVESTAQFQVEMSNGKRVTGTIQKSSTAEGSNGDFLIRNADAEETLVRAIDVVAFQSQKSNVWRQMKGSVGFGFSYDSGSSETSVNINATDSYTSTKFQVGGSLNSTITGRSGTGRTNRQEISTYSSIFLSRHAFIGNLADFLTSDQQSLNLRQTYGGGYGRYFIRTNNMRLSWLGGSVYVKESFYPDSGPHPNDQNVEGLLQLNYDWFHFNTSQLQTNFQIFPGISDAGRVRTNLNTSYAVKFTRDLGLTFSLWDSFDSRPPTDTRNNEFGVSTTFALTF